MVVLRKDEMEMQLKSENQLIRAGTLHDESPLDNSEEFHELCDACRRGDLRECQEIISTGVNINARDRFDYTPLILASLCGHYEVVQLLLESGALCERDTFQGERCLYNALTDRIRNLLLEYDYSKSADPLQPLASHITSLLTRRIPTTSDITLTAGTEVFHAHKFILAARSSYFRKKLESAPETSHWNLPHIIPVEAFHVVLRYLYFGEIPPDVGIGSKSRAPGEKEEQVLKGIDKLSKQLGVESLWDSILAVGDRRIARQRHQDEVSRGRSQLQEWYRDNILGRKVIIGTEDVGNVRFDRKDTTFADVVLRADAETDEESLAEREDKDVKAPTSSPSRKSILYPVHRAMLIRSEYFMTMFSSRFQEARFTPYLHVIPVDCSPEVLEVILRYLYTEMADFSLDVAIDVLFAADMLFIEKLKTKAVIVISTLGNGRTGALTDRTRGEGNHDEVELINIYDVIRASWLTRVQRLEEFAARYLAYRLEDYIDEDEFEELIKESASRIKGRQETDTIELLDDIRYYLSERFRLRFEDVGLHVLMNEKSERPAEVTQKPPAAINNEQISTDVSDGTGIRYGEGVPSQKFRTLNGNLTGDEFSSDAINYKVLSEKIDRLLEKLKLGA